MMFKKYRETSTVKSAGRQKYHLELCLMVAISQLVTDEMQVNLQNFIPIDSLAGIHTKCMIFKNQSSWGLNLEKLACWLASR